MTIEPPTPHGSLDALGIALPPGRLAPTDEGAGDARPLWLSDGPATAELWAELRAAHPRSGWWPLLLTPLAGDAEWRPWASGELFPADMSDPATHDPAVLLADWWRQHTGVADDDPLPTAERTAGTAPHGRAWPGLAPAGVPAADPGRRADALAPQFLAAAPTARLGLVRAPSGAHAIAAAGWQGPVNYESDTGRYAAVLASWEERFGARVVGVGFASLLLSVAAPPTTSEAALAVAAEHFACCPDNVWQGTPPHTLTAYAEQLVAADAWYFWWD